MIEFNIMKRSYILPVVMLLFMFLGACGMQGDLYLPEEENKLKVEK